MERDPILELIPKEQLSARQKALLPATRQGMLPLYKLTREPVYLDDIDWEAYSDMSICIWRDNETLICVSPMIVLLLDKKRPLFHIYHRDKFNLDCAVYGETEAEVLETVTFFWSLKGQGDNSIRLIISEQTIDRVDYTFDFATLQPEQLARILDANPTRRFFLGRGVWNAEQSIVLASRPNTLDLHLTKDAQSAGFAFEDDGTVFVRELEKRQSSFGSLSVTLDKIPFSRANFERLFELETFEKLEIGDLGKDLVLLPFSAKAETLAYEISSNTLQPEDCGTLEIVNKNLQLKIKVDSKAKNWDTLPISFLSRMAELGHFERFAFIVIRHDWGGQKFQDKKVERVAKALIHAISGNPKLKYLNLDTTIYHDPKECIDWASSFKILFKAIEVHEGLRTLVVENYPSKKNPENYSLLEKLLSRNRNIAVLDRSGNKISNGTSINKLYARNVFYNGSAELVTASISVRPSLVGTTLVESALNNFQYSALLLSNHEDFLCERVQASIEEHDEENDIAQPMAMETETEASTTSPRDSSSESAPKKMRTSD